MKVEIHHHHHLGADEVKLALQIKQGLLSVEAKLDRIWEKIKFMADQEQELNAGIAELRDVTVGGFRAISESVDKAAQRVIQRLEAKDIDLSDEVSILNEMKAAVRSSSDDAVQRLDAIAADGESSSEEPAGGETGGSSSGGEVTLGETTSDATGGSLSETSNSENTASETSVGETSSEASEADTAELPATEADGNPFPPAVDNDKGDQ